MHNVQQGSMRFTYNQNVLRTSVGAHNDHDQGPTCISECLVKSLFRSWCKESSKVTSQTSHSWNLRNFAQIPWQESVRPTVGWSEQVRGLSIRFLGELQVIGHPFFLSRLKMALGTVHFNSVPPPATLHWFGDKWPLFSAIWPLLSCNWKHTWTECAESSLRRETQTS